MVKEVEEVSRLGWISEDKPRWGKGEEFDAADCRLMVTI